MSVSESRHGGGGAGTLETGCYVYGILPADVEITPDARGIGGRPVELVRQGGIAALVSAVPVSEPIGRPEDLAAHERLLDTAAVEAPVLPMRFGAVLTDARAVAEELLGANHDQFLAALRELEGKAEYVVKGRYVERAVLREVLAQDPQAARLRERVHGVPEARSRGDRIRLGELIEQGIAARRAADTRRVIETLSPYSVSAAERERTHQQDAAHVAFLVEHTRRDGFEKAVGDLARDWSGRVDLRLLGPLAPYDFVVTPRAGG